ncbi:ubiquitin-conjugating enzyme E2-binding protein [Podospora didyma]|uniref:Ubiquitin-conjugating enzyme E2-binding protein n=1 Tax=Podospora didyma TaxID=330526 RepID=A0AAE0P474_9PEZI|nr:ubiquitin-conjugating enzyme E2-binding protein [Podospora didyma]
MLSHSSIYAELLSNIRQISLAVSLRSPSDGSTRVAVTADGSDVELRHQGEMQRLALPAKIAHGGAVLPINTQGVSTLTWRLPLDPTSSQQKNTTDGDAAPWSATDLEAGSAVTCRQCGAVVVDRDAIKVWKDLPSENWAEMMEFWHCHKPNEAEHHSHENGKADDRSLAARGYGASSNISAQNGVGFVDLTTLLFSESASASLTFSTSGYEHGSTDRHALAETNASGSQHRGLNVFCSACHTQLGFFNFRAAAVTLLKWQISCKSTSAHTPDISECLAATIISTISRSASSKALITPINDTPIGTNAQANTRNALHIWVMNKDIVYSTSTAERSTPAIKLLYRLVPREQAERMLEVITCDAQEISIPSDALGRVIQSLDESNMLLPGSERLFQQWKVGLLAR